LGTQRRPELPDRFAEVDLVKAVGILTVVLIHAVRSPFEPGPSGVELWIGQWTRFAVPGFLAASGFLYAGHQPVGRSPTRARLTRIAVPYLVFSLIAQILRHTQGPERWEPDTGHLWLDLLFGASLGPYYYVFVAAVMVSLTPLCARLGLRALWGLFAVEWLAQGALELTSPLPFFWHLRNPLLWLAYFHLGWLARLHQPALVALTARHRAASTLAAAVLAGACVTALAVGRPPSAQRLIEWLAIYPILATLFLAVCGRSRVPGIGGAVRRLSDASYTLYLIHPFLVIPLKQAMSAPPGRFDPVVLAAVWGGAVVGALGLTAAARALLGRRSRAWIGS
jgi:peptidoglycan/LPS O-acetylase OafA/YrhL